MMNNTKYTEVVASRGMNGVAVAMGLPVLESLTTIELRLPMALNCLPVSVAGFWARPDSRSLGT